VYPRWRGTTPEQRSAEMTRVRQIQSRRQREAKLAALIESAPPLTDAQIARLRQLLDAVPVHDES
jgi:hypothetical protein